MTENAGTAVTVEAMPNAGFVFDHWESNFTALMPDQDSVQLNLFTCLDDTLTAVLLPVYTVTIQVTGTGSATIEGVDASSFNGTFLSTDVIDIAALENGPCGLFIDWEIVSGNAVIANTGGLNTTMTVTSDVVIQVNFTSLPAGMVEVVFTSPYPDAGGFSVNGNNYATYPQSLMLPPGVPLNLEAIEADWYDFLNWNSTMYSFVPNGNTPVTSITVCSADTLTVNYNFTPHQLVTITKTPTNIGQVFVDGVEVFNLPVTYDWAEGENHSVGALTLAPWTSFVEWQSSGIVLNPNTTASTVNFMVTEQDTITAVFYEIPHSLITVVVDEPYTAQASATGGGSSNYSFQFEVENGVSVTFSSTINDFYDFKNWSSAQDNFISPSPESEEIMMSFEANDTITLHTVREIYGYYIPNSFSPNGDNVNDCIGPVGNAVQIDRFNWVVFNRYGEVVFETDEFGDCWDGSYQGGEYYVPDGVYTYVLRVKSVFDKEIQKVSGSIIVVR